MIRGVRSLIRFTSRAKTNADYIKESSEFLDVSTFRKKILWRSGHLGMRELDKIVGDWAEKHVESMSVEHCQQFEEEVLSLESVDLYEFLTDKAQFPELERRKVLGLVKKGEPIS